MSELCLTIAVTVDLVSRSQLLLFILKHSMAVMNEKVPECNGGHYITKS